MVYMAKSSSIQDAENARRKSRNKIAWCIVYSLMIITIYFGSGMLEFLEKSIEYLLRGHLSEEKQEAVTITLTFTAFAFCLLVFFMCRLPVHIKRFKKRDYYLSLLLASKVEIEGDTISGTHFATETSLPERFSISKKDLTAVSHRYEKLNLTFHVGEKKYQCLELDKAKELSVFFKNELQEREG